MHPTIYMLEKELIEHKMVTRIPLFILACGLVLFLGLAMNTDLQQSMSYSVTYSGNGDFMPGGFTEGLNLAIASAAWFVSVSLSALYLPKTLRKERQEGSSMFWRSMPVSYEMTHAVKLAFGLLVIPLICSVLVIGANLMLWLLNIATENQLTVLVSQESFLNIISNWGSYMGRMVLVAVALLPLACVALMVSQLVSSPIVVMIIAIYAARWLPAYVFGFDGIDTFFNSIFAIPADVFSQQPLHGFAQAGIINLVVYYTLGAVGFLMSLSLSKTNDVSFKHLYPFH